MLAKKTYKNQLTLPKAIIKNLEKVEYFDVSRRGDNIILKPVTILKKNSTLNKVRQKIIDLGLSEEEIENALKWARKK